jgi:hypothetical protein
MTSLASLMAPDGVITPNKAQILTNKDLSSSSNTLPVFMPVTIVSGTTVTCVAGNHYVLTNISVTTATLPAGPASGDTIWITIGNNLTTNIIARNASTIMLSASDMTIDSITTVRLRYINSDWKLV